MSIRTPNPPPPPFNETSPVQHEVTGPSPSSRPDLVQEKIDVKEPGVAVARKGVKYDAEDDEETKEFEAKLLAMEQEMKAEKAAPPKTIAKGTMLCTRSI